MSRVGDRVCRVSGRGAELVRGVCFGWLRVDGDVYVFVMCICMCGLYV